MAKDDKANKAEGRNGNISRRKLTKYLAIGVGGAVLLNYTIWDGSHPAYILCTGK